jgi:hypothetical protein
MPPLISTLLMMEFGCDFRIIAAIDRNMEWIHQLRIRHYSDECISYYTSSWYDGYIGIELSPMDTIGTYRWPNKGRKWTFVYKENKLK